MTTGTSAWAIAAAVALAVIVALIAAFGTLGYYITGRRVKQPFFAFMARYSVIFILLILMEVAFLWLAPSVHETMRDLTASFVGRALLFSGVSHTVAGSVITVENPNIAFSIDTSCLGGILFWTFIALVLAESGVTPRQRLAGLAAGLAMLVVFNLFRIFVSIYLEWRTGVNVHNYFYLFNMVFVLLVWAGWVWTLKPRPSRGGTT